MVATSPQTSQTMFAPSPGNAADKNDRLFISQVPQSISKEDLRMHFEQFGELTDVYLPASPGAGSHKGICFVSFKESTSLKRATASLKHDIKGESISIDIAAPRAPPPETV